MCACREVYTHASYTQVHLGQCSELPNVWRNPLAASLHLSAPSSRAFDSRESRWFSACYQEICGYPSGHPSRPRI